MRSISVNVMFGLMTASLLGIAVNMIHFLLCMAGVAGVPFGMQWWDAAFLFIPLLLMIVCIVYDDWKRTGITGND